MNQKNHKNKCYVCKDLGIECNLEKELNEGLEPILIQKKQYAIARGLGFDPKSGNKIK